MKIKLKDMLLIFLVMFTAILMNPAIVKADVDYPSASSRSYIEIAAQKTVNVYRYSNLSVRGTSSPAKSYNAYASRGDIVYVYSVNSSVCYISYPVGSSRRLGYCSTSSLFLLSKANRVITSTGTCTVYKYSTGTYYGSIAKNDKVYCIGTANNKLFVVYTARSGNRAYKCGWITLSDYDRIKNKTTPKSTTVSLREVNITTGMYTITSGLSNSKVVDVNGAGKANGTNIHLWETNMTPAQGFVIEKLSNGWYIICNMKSGKAIDVAGGQVGQEVNVQLYDRNETAAQQWKFYDAGNGYFYIKNRLGYYLDVWGGRTGNGTNIQVYGFHGGNNQKWKLAYKDLTRDINSVFFSELYMDSALKNHPIEKLGFYFKYFNHNKKYDIKNPNRWKELFPEIMYPQGKVKQYTGRIGYFCYNNSKVNPEDLGNILYGLTGRYLGFCNRLIYQGGGYAANGTKYLNSPENYGDDPNDHYFIKKGIEMIGTQQTIDLNLAECPKWILDLAKNIL